MKSIFLDTNFVIDFLADRKPFSIHAAKLFDLAQFKKIKLYISAVSYNNIYYIISQSLTEKETMHLLNEISDMAEIADVTKDVIKKSLKTDFKDFEDAIQYHCAMNIGSIDFLVTRDVKDFKKSSLPVLTPTEAMVMLENN